MKPNGIKKIVIKKIEALACPDITKAKKKLYIKIKYYSIE
jgi:hypothetical protein